MRQAQAQADGERVGHFVQLLAAPAQHEVELAEAAMGLQIAHMVAALRKAVAHLLDQVALVLGNVALEFLARLDHDFGCGGRRGRAQIRDKIGDGEIGFVADACDHRNFRSENRAGDNFFVERPQIFQRAAAAREDQHVHNLARLKYSSACAISPAALVPCTFVG